MEKKVRRLVSLSEATYMRLDEVRGKRESFSQAVDRLLNLHDAMSDVSKTLGPSHFLKSEQPPVGDRS